MPVLNIAQNVYTPSPIRSAMAGKAARIAMESQKLQNTAMEQEIGAFDEREARDERKLQAYEEQVGLQGRQEERLAKEAEAEQKQRAAQQFQEALVNPVTRQVLSSGLDEYESADSEDKKKEVVSKIEQRLERFYPELKEMADENSDGLLSEDEINAVRGQLGAVPPDAGKERYTIIDGVLLDKVSGSYTALETAADGNKTAAMQNAERILEIARNDEYSEQEKRMLIKALGGHLDDTGVTIDQELASDVAGAIMDQENLGESGFPFYANDDVVEGLLTVELMRLWKLGADPEKVKKEAIAGVKRILQEDSEEAEPEEQTYPTPSVQALQKLQQNYDEYKDAFKKRYGYLPERE